MVNFRQIAIYFMRFFDAGTPLVSIRLALLTAKHYLKELPLQIVSFRPKFQKREGRVSIKAGGILALTENSMVV